MQRLASIVGGDDLAVVGRINLGAGDFVVSNELEDFCGVMAGLRVTTAEANVEASLGLNAAKGNAINIISLDHGGTFLKLEYKGVPVFVSTSREIIDVDAKLTSQNFDVRDHFVSTVPPVRLLERSYGCVNFQEVLTLMKRQGSSTNIAFIPWNWRRSTPEVVRPFRENPEQYSISVHGCDHTRAEFGSPDRQRLYWKAKQAVERITGHEFSTGIHHDRVMVFPQGVFSEAAMNVLKHANLIAAVNNDVISPDPYPRAITISEVWDIAVMGYSNFPIFTRRYPWEGVENFAFDILLGKPCIVVIHHDFCRDRCAHLLEFIKQLNALNGQLL